MVYELIAPCHFGLEACTKKEITELGYEIKEVSDGKITFIGDERAICRANIFMRTTERILLKAGEFKAYTWDELFNKVYDIPWENYIPRDGRVWVAKAASIKSKLFSPRDFQTIIQKAIIKRLQKAYDMEGERLPMDGASYALRVSAYKDNITIGIDTSGESLHKRGYRKMTAKAPITETLAAALIMLTPWNKDRILVDPFCGSGTFLIEAAMMAAKIAPGMERNFAATSWKNIIDRQLWYDAYDEARALADSVNIEELKQIVDIQGFDIDPEVLYAARYNAEKAGVRELIHFQERDVKELSHPKKYGFIITNPPYGERLEEKSDMPPIYTALGERYAALDSWSMYLITGYEDAEKYIGRKADKNRKIYNGMMKTYFYSYIGAKPIRQAKRANKESE
ncbi:MAG: class I SAM-dependent RNA methyltransferase [Eubacteriales bacterium]|nr:class I SAM-dependent RNA methyltransferase [Eubacteriales bacterium]